MQVEFIGNKAQLASDKHFGGKLTEAQMAQLVVRVIKNADYIGQSDRSNGTFTPARIIWSEVAGIMIAVMLDGADAAKGKATVISIYDVNNHEHKAKRFGMKKVVK